MKLYTKDFTYPNYYSKKNETITLTWRVEDGFNTIETAMEDIDNLGQDPYEFLYIHFDGMYYPVAICTLSEEVLIAKDYIWIRNGYNRGSINNPFPKYDRRKKDNPKNKIPYEVTNQRITSLWNTRMIDVLKEFDENFGCAGPFKYPDKLIQDCMVLFGCAMFDTMIPVYELNCVDGFFQWMPSRMKLGLYGVRACNPFTWHMKYGKKHTRYNVNFNGKYTPYKYSDYLREKAKRNQNQKQ